MVQESVYIVGTRRLLVTVGRGLNSKSHIMFLFVTSSGLICTEKRGGFIRTW